MANGVVYSGEEMTQVMLQIQGYAAKVALEISSAVATLEAVQRSGIQDESICSQIKDLILQLQSEKIAVGEFGSALTSVISKTEGLIVSSDTYRFS